MARERNNKYNYYTSQLHICIEMAFGLMLKRWSILQRPISIANCNIEHLICSIGVLHNYCINEQLFIARGNGIFVAKNTNFSPEETVLQNSAAEFDGEILVYDLAAPHSNNREWVVMELEMILCAAKTPNLVTL